MPHRDRRNIWVVRTATGYAVRRERTATSLHRVRRQCDAIALGRVAARAAGCELIIQDRHGRIRARDSHGRDPFPPRG